MFVVGLKTQQMHTISVLLLITVIFQGINGRSDSASIVFNTTQYALTNRCVWSTCNVPGVSSPFFNYTLDCCTLQVPLNYAKPDRNISLAMSRLTPSQASGRNNTLFILAGGPGGSGWGLIGAMAQIFSASFGITIILPDHRGTGWSTALGCDDNLSQNISVDCISYLKSKWGVEGLNQFSVTAAAHDLSMQIQSHQADRPGRIAVYGLSYGTFWLDRFLQIYPTLVHSAIMDGVWNPLMSSISRYELGGSAVAVQFLSHCQSQPQCNRYFPSRQPPHIMLYNILTELDSNNQKCIKNHFTRYHIDSDTLRNLFFELINSADRYMDRIVIPAVIYRLNRCSVDDVGVLDFFFRSNLIMTRSSVETQLPRGFAYSSLSLAQNIIQSEEWLSMNESELDNETIASWHQSTIIAPNFLKTQIALRSHWPKYPIDQYRYKVASYSPLLMISGQLDPATPFENIPQLASITAKTRAFYGVPLVGHVTLAIAQVGYHCPLHLICSWAFPNLFPVEWGDPKCIGELPTTIDFMGTTELGQQYSMKLLNISRPFGDDTSEIIISSGSDRKEALRLVIPLFLLGYFVLVGLLK